MTKKKKLIMLVAQLGVLLIAIMATFFWIATEKKEVTIYDYARTIQFNDKSNYQLVESDLVEVQLMAADVKPEYAINKEDIIGKYITGDVFKGSHVLSKQLSADPPYIDKGNSKPEAELRKIYLPISYAEAFAGDIKAGDTVDLLFLDNNSGITTDDTEKATSKEDGSITYAAARIFMQGLSVYQVYTADGSVYERKETDPLTLGVHKGELAEAGVAQQEQQQQNPSVPAYVALAVTGPQFEEITSRQKMGKITLVGRFDGSQDQETNGYVVAKGDTADIYAGQGTLEKDLELFDSSQPVDPSVNALPKLYSFIRDISKVQMTDTQRQRYAAAYTKYADYMGSIYGSEWENNDPDSVTMEMIAAYVCTDDDSTTLFTQFKSELEELAKELRGNQVVLPW